MSISTHDILNRARGAGSRGRVHLPQDPNRVRYSSHSTGARGFNWFIIIIIIIIIDTPIK